MAVAPSLSSFSPEELGSLSWGFGRRREPTSSGSLLPEHSGVNRTLKKLKQVFETLLQPPYLMPAPWEPGAWPTEFRPNLMDIGLETFACRTGVHNSIYILWLDTFEAGRCTSSCRKEGPLVSHVLLEHGVVCVPDESPSLPCFLPPPFSLKLCAEVSTFFSDVHIAKGL